MVRVCVFQTDNRPTLDYLLKTREINRKFCSILRYNYLFLELDNKKYGNLHPATKKVFVVNEFLQNAKCDILVFLDSDAWIQDGVWLNTIITNLMNSPTKQGAFSRDPYLKINTYINSGSFILKVNDMTRQMYSMIIRHLQINRKCHNEWPFDQFYISDFVFRNKDNFVIFVPDVLNTPRGKVLRHNWGKDKKMYTDLDALNQCIDNGTCFPESPFLEIEYYCTQEFPNPNEEGYGYND
jgi:hypothetical protein